LNSLLLAILAGLSGAILKWIIPVVSEWLRIKLKTKELVGEWYSEYQDIDNSSSLWVKEKINIDLPFLSGKLKIENADSSKEYSYIGNAEIIDKTYLNGSWKSIRKASNANGCFILSIDSQGQNLYGYWVGSDKIGARRFGMWVLSKEKNNIEEAKKLLKESRKPYHTE
jgi:hypothetical protein